MKLPAVCLAAAFAGGAALGLYTPLNSLATSVFAFRFLFLLAGLLLLAGAILLQIDFVTVAGSASLLSWLTLGILGALCASQPLPENHVLTLIGSGKVDISSPLRWHAHLRDEPAALSSGVSFDLALDSVEFEQTLIPITGGMRLAYFQPNDSNALLPFHAGDAIAFLAQARLPQTFRDEGAFDRRAFLRQQGIHLTATLRSASLIDLESPARFTAANLLSRLRSGLRHELDSLFQDSAQVAGVLRAMLLGDRSFIDRDESVAFQKTGVFHVLVVAGLHVGSFAVFLYWLGRKLRLSVGWTTIFLLATLGLYVAVIEQRPPVLRAALMATVVIFGGYFFRKLELLNSAAIAATLLLLWNPLELRDSSFQLSFLSIGCIAGVAVPWLDRTVEPYVRGLRGWRDVTRDAAHVPRVIQFRIDLRSLVSWLTAKLPQYASKLAGDIFLLALRICFRVWELVFLTLVLQIGMAPAMATDFHRVTLFGALANLLAVPLTGFLVPAGFLLLFVGSISHFLATWLAIPIRFLTGFLIHVVGWFAQFRFGGYRVPGPPLWVTALFFVTLLGLCFLLRMEPKRRVWTLSLVAILFALTGLLAKSPFPPRFARGSMELTVLDVGQGDSLLLVSPAGRTLLIDGGGEAPNYGGKSSLRGPDPGEEAVSPYLWSRGVKKLDVVALTHAHQDHLGGLSAIFENFQVGELWIGREVQSTALAALEQLARARGTIVRKEGHGDSFDWDGIQCELLWPEKTSGEAFASAKNNDSLVLHVRYGLRALLLPGDAESQAEASILAENPETQLQSDVLKVGHHGSKNSTTPAFLAAVHPQLAIISAGAENPYGHPSNELIQRLQNADVSILRTDQNGAVHVLTDGKNLEVSCFLDCGAFRSEPVHAQSQHPNSQEKSE